jgi:hypothetical protein
MSVCFCCSKVDHLISGDFSESFSATIENIEALISARDKLVLVQHSFKGPGGSEHAARASNDTDFITDITSEENDLVDIDSNVPQRRRSSEIPLRSHGSNKVSPASTHSNSAPIDAIPTANRQVVLLPKLKSRKMYDITLQEGFNTRLDFSATSLLITKVLAKQKTFREAKEDRRRASLQIQSNAEPSKFRWLCSTLACCWSFILKPSSFVIDPEGK